MKKLLLALVLLVSITASAQSLQKYTRGLKLTTAEINAIDTTRTDVVYRAYNTDLGIEIINRRDNQGWVPLVTAGGITDAQIASGFLNIYPNADTDATDDFSGDYNDLTNLPPYNSSNQFNSIFIGDSQNDIGGMAFFHPQENAFGNGNLNTGKLFFNFNNLGWAPPSTSIGIGYQFVGIPTEIVDIILPTSGTVDLTNIGSGVGTDDQTLPEVLTEGNDAGGQSITNLLGISSEYITPRRTSNPSPEEGRFYYNSFDNVLRVYTGGKWQDIAYSDDVDVNNGIEWDLATSKTMQIDDANKIFYKSESDNGVKQFVIPLNSNVSYDSDVAFTFNHEGGAGIIRVRGESGVNITPKRLNSLGTMSLIRRGIDNWVWIGAYEDDINANPETYTLNNCLSINTNTNSVDGLTALVNTTQASVLNTSPEDVDYMWQITSTAVSENTRGREVFIVEDAKTYEVRFWVKGKANMAYKWESQTTDNSFRTVVITESWQQITETITTTGVNPTLSFYLNHLDSGNVGDVIEVAGLTMKEIETGL
ncbi:hypothetical protein MAR621_03113 [Maribacter dokdonensis]|uniref:hypothetical protein n=1 Tax=Maribacter dokdonensis TaxID=320912 RepID=UPI001B132EE7|nr:hypothetical protein [Maribacter dokdonensis]CAG2532919.1 hypothetical protein MAR621_03113 [Maribacter dokdonensis]